jgi:hypothetical protein
MHISYWSLSAASMAFVAAALWIWSAIVPMPDRIATIRLGSWSSAPKAVDDLDRLTAGLKKQSKLSAAAALAAAGSATLQAIAVVVPS